MDYRRLAQFSPFLMGISIVLQILVRIPGIGSNIYGSYRWFDFGFASFQPSEMAKLSLILFLAFSLSKKDDVLQSFWKGLVPYLLVVGVIDGLLMLEPHFSGTILITSVAVIILFSAGAKVWHFTLLALPALPLGAYLVVTEEYRLKRYLTFLNPFEIPRQWLPDCKLPICNRLWRVIWKRHWTERTEEPVYPRTPYGLYFLHSG